MRLTFFQSRTDRSASRHEVEWESFAQNVANPPSYPTKESCPLVKLAVFGNLPSPKGFLRHDANVVGVSGVEIDFDAGTVPLETAADALHRAGVKALLYTSPRHTPKAPRWRILAPLSTEYEPEYRRGFVAFLDGLIGNIAARESYALSQSYYVGKVDGTEYQAVILDGRCVDELTEPVAAPLKFAADTDIPEWQSVDVASLPVAEDVKAMIRTGAPQGERSEALLSVANALARARVNPDDILRVLSDPANAISAKALEGRQQRAAMEWLSRHTVRKALEAFPPLDVIHAPPPPFPSARRQRGLFIHESEMLSDFGKPNWLVEGILEAGVLGVVFGQPGTGKSFVTMGWAASIAAGVPWNNRATRQGRCCYIAGEGFAGIGRRMAAWSQHTGHPIPSNLHFTRRAVPFADAAAIAELLAEIDALPDAPAIVVIDTLTRAAPGLDLDKAKDMSVFVRQCDRIRERYNCAVLIVHHSGHGDKSRAMNSIALLGAVDFEAGVTREDRDTLRLTCTKAKDADPFDDIFLKFETVEFLIGGPDAPQMLSSVVLVESEAVPRPGKHVPTHLALVREIVETAGEPISSTQARDDFVRLHGGKVPTARRAFYGAVDKAIAEGLVLRDDATGMLSRAFGGVVR